MTCHRRPAWHDLLVTREFLASGEMSKRMTILNADKK